jgi:hypothetical protein
MRTARIITIITDKPQGGGGSISNRRTKIKTLPYHFMFSFLLDNGKKHRHWALLIRTWPPFFRLTMIITRERNNVESLCLSLPISASLSLSLFFVCLLLI